MYDEKNPRTAERLFRFGMSDISKAWLAEDFWILLHIKWFFKKQVRSNLGGQILAGCLAFLTLC